MERLLVTAQKLKKKRALPGFRTSGLGSTEHGRMLMNFYFFTQIALLGVDYVLGRPAWIPSSQASIVAPAPKCPLDRTSLRIALLGADSVLGRPTWIPSSQASIVAPASKCPLDGTSSRVAEPQVMVSHDYVNGVTSVDSSLFWHKTRRHIRQPFSGLGSTEHGRMLMNFYFFAQVGGKYSVYSIRDDLLTFIVLPSPQCLIVTLYDCLHVVKLLLSTSGDVELNPGPTSDSETEGTVNGELLKILKEQTKTNKTLVAQSSNMKQFEITIGNVQDKIASTEKELARLKKCEDKLVEHEAICKCTKELVQELSAKVDDLENRSRRNNVVIYGLSEEPNEDNSSLED